jgi:GDP-4-dehydro-6-deoxy-D-mannose reductase
LEATNQLSRRHQQIPVLITGGAGFAGRYLANYLKDLDRIVYVFDRNRLAGYGEDWKSTVEEQYVIDLTQPKDLRETLKRIRPAEIYHLAGRANVKHSWYGESETYLTNVIGAVNLMCAVRDTGLNSDLLIVSSGEVYGLVPEHDQPITEKQQPMPGSPYAASKLCQEIAVLQLARSMKGKTVVVRPFNHIGPGQRLGFVTADFACQIARIEQEKQNPVIQVGNLDARRDFTDVRDIVEGYVKALQFGKNQDVINLCSNKVWSVKEILDHLISISRAEISMRIDPDRFRPADIHLLQGNHDYITRLSQWSPKRNLANTLKEILDYWRNQVSRERSSRS